MGRYAFVIKRPLQLLPVLIGVSLITFFLLQAVPGDPVRTLLGEKATEEVIASIRARYGLDKPVIAQYFHYMGNLLTGDLGPSIKYKVPVVDLLGSRVPATLYLLVMATVMSVLITVPLAVISAVWANRWPDTIIRALTTAGLGLPSFWFGIMMIILFSVWLRIFPVAGFGEGFFGHIYHLILPSLTIAIALSAILTRTMRASLIEMMNADFVTAATAKGLPARWVFGRHVLRNSLIPVINLLGVNLGWLIGGTVVIESVFSIPGLGQLMVQSIFARDYFVVQSLTLCFACATILVSFVVDIITVTLDPRIRL